jgi:hypothetical protein
LLYLIIYMTHFSYYSRCVTLIWLKIIPILIFIKICPFLIKTVSNIVWNPSNIVEYNTWHSHTQYWTWITFFGGWIGWVGDMNNILIFLKRKLHRPFGAGRCAPMRWYSIASDHSTTRPIYACCSSRRCNKWKFQFWLNSSF